MRAGIIASSRVGVPSSSYRQTIDYSGTASTTLTLTNVDFGPPDPTRQILVAATTASGLYRSMTGILINDISGVVDASTGSIQLVAFARGDAPSGTTGSITLTFSATISNAAISIHSLIRKSAPIAISANNNTQLTVSGEGYGVALAFASGMTYPEHYTLDYLDTPTRSHSYGSGGGTVTTSSSTSARRAAGIAIY